MITDRVVRNILAPALLIIFLGLLTPAILSATIIILTDFFQSAETKKVLWIIERFQNFEGIPSDLTAFFVQVLPALIGGICYQRNPEITLNWLGRATLILLFLGAIISVAVVIYINPHDQDQVYALSSGKEGLLLMKSGSEASLRTSVTYILLFTGLQIEIQKPPSLNR